MLPHAVTRILACVGSRSSQALAATSRCSAATNLADQLLLTSCVPSPSAALRFPLPFPSASSSFSSPLSPLTGLSFSSKSDASTQPPSSAAAGAEAAEPSSSDSTSNQDPSTSTAATLADPAASPAGPASRRDKGAPIDTIYPSSQDDNLGVQRNWFNALFSQLNVVNRTGMAPPLKGRQREVFCAVEREFEGLWERHIRGKGLQGTAHRGMLLCCLAIATHKVLRYESGDDDLVKEVVHTNLGGMALGIMSRLHKARLWLLLRLLAEDPYKQAVGLLPSLQGDLGSLLDSRTAVGDREATWTISRCGFYSVLAEEDALELLPEFCCHYSMQWLEAFTDYGVRVGLEQSLAYGDECCQVRISRRLTAAEAAQAEQEAEAQRRQTAEAKVEQAPQPEPQQQHPEQQHKQQ